MKTKVGIAGFALLVWLNMLLWGEVLHSGAFELAFFNVGQGDAVYLETKQGHQILIDGGPDSSVLSRLGEVMPPWDRSLDLLLLTHSDADHASGLVEVLSRYRVDAVLWNGVARDTAVFQAFSEALENEEAKQYIAKAGQEVRWSRHPKERLIVFYPFSELEDGVPSNETSVVSKLVYHNNSALLPGDTTSKVERRLVKEGADISADILKVAHHGSNTSSAREFLEAVNPRTAVISAGRDNRFGHPTQEVLERLSEYGIEIRRTDQEGTITFTFPPPRFDLGVDN